MKQEFEMTQQNMDDIIAINKSKMPVMMIGNVTTGMDLAERVNAYWEGLGNEMGFKHMTVEGSGKGKLFFLAEPKAKVVPKTPLEIEMDKFNTIGKIVQEMERLNFDSEAGFLINNVAFLSLKKMAK